MAREAEFSNPTLELPGSWEDTLDSASESEAGPDSFAQEPYFQSAEIQSY